MNPLAWLNPYRWILMGALIAAVVFGVPLMIHRHNEAQREIGRQEVREQDREAMQKQADSNRDMQRAAEKHYVVVAEVRDHYIVATVTEIRHETENLAACGLSPDAVRLLNAASACASADSAASCVAGKPVSAAR